MNRLEIVACRSNGEAVFSGLLEKWRWGIKMAKMVTDGRSSMYLQKAPKLSKQWGLPQIAEKRYIEGVLFLSAEIFCFYKIFSYNHKGNSYYDKYKKADNVSDAVKYRGLTENYDTKRNKFLLVFRLANILTKSFDLFQYRISGGCPDERPGVGIGVLDEMVDLPDQVFHASECAPADGLLGDDIEPYLHLVQPGSIGRRKMNLKARMSGQPALNPWMLMGAIVVDHQMHE